MMQEVRCTEIEERLIEFAEGKLPEETERRYVAHLEACPLCAELVAEARAIFAPADPAVAENAPDTLWRAIQTKLNRIDKGRLKQPTLLSTRRPFVSSLLSYSLRGLGAAAALLVGIYLGSGSSETAESSELSYEDQLVEYYAAAFQAESAMPVGEVITEFGEAGQ